MSQRFALIAITLGLLLAGWLDGQDAQLMEQHVTIACIDCAGGAR